MMKNKYSFSLAPSIKARRTRFDLSHDVKTAFNVGELCPIYLQEIYPGDTFKVDTSFVARTSSPYVKPVMDNLYLDMYYFFVPSRLVFDKWAQVFGESTSEWADNEEVEVPHVEIVQDGISRYSVLDYLGICPSSNGFVDITFSCLPVRAFAKVYNDWFRDENNIDPMNIITGDWNYLVETPNDLSWSPTNYFGMLPKVAKFHDYFTSCLPSPQKGNAVELTVGQILPVTADSQVHNTGNNIRFGATELTGTTSGMVFGLDASNNFTIKEIEPEHYVTTDVNSDLTNLVVDSRGLSNLSVNDLRYALALQRMLELDARGGTRYIEYIYSHFGVVSPDGRLQRAEYLTGARVPLNVQQVAKTADDVASLGAYSLTNGNSYFSKSFVEHGFVIGVACARYKHTYTQGLPRFWSRRKRTDFYDPIFANIGEQPVYTKELYIDENPNTIFGYNEAWADLRFRSSYATGAMRTNGDSMSNEIGDLYTFGDNYDSEPVLSQDFIEETNLFVDRTLSYESSVLPNLIFEFYHKVDAIRELPLYSIPSITESPIYK